MTTISIKDVESAYSGKDGKCCCGCSGKHYYLKAQGDYRGGGTTKDATQVKRILNIVNAAEKKEVDSVFVSAVVDTRLYIVYLKQESQ